MQPFYPICWLFVFSLSTLLAPLIKLEKLINNWQTNTTNWTQSSDSTSALAKNQICQRSKIKLSVKAQRKIKQAKKTKKYKKTMRKFTCDWCDHAFDSLVWIIKSSIFIIQWSCIQLLSVRQITYKGLKFGWVIINVLLQLLQLESENSTNKLNLMPVLSEKREEIYDQIFKHHNQIFKVMEHEQYFYMNCQTAMESKDWLTIEEFNCVQNSFLTMYAAIKVSTKTSKKNKIKRYQQLKSHMYNNKSIPKKECDIHCHCYQYAIEPFIWIFNLPVLIIQWWCTRSRVICKCFIKIYHFFVQMINYNQSHCEQYACKTLQKVKQITLLQILEDDVSLVALETEQMRTRAMGRRHGMKSRFF